MNYAAHGYAGYFCYSLLDRHWKPDMSVEEATVSGALSWQACCWNMLTRAAIAQALMAKCVVELRTRFMLHQPSFILKIADKDGIRELEFKP